MNAESAGKPQDFSIKFGINCVNQSHLSGNFILKLLIEL